MKYLKEYIVILILVNNVYCYGERYVIQPDTSYFIDYDDDFNLIMAAEQGDNESLLILLNRGADVNAKTYDGVTALMYACQNGHFKAAQILVEHDANVNLSPDNGITALIASVKNDDSQLAEYLLNHNSDINACDKDGVTSLMYAVAYQYYAMVDILIYYKAEIDREDEKGTTALMIATYNNDDEMIKLLVDNGANPFIIDKDGFNALMIASQIGNIEFVKFLVSEGEDINRKNIYGYNALSIAVKNGYADLVRILIQNGADINTEINPSLMPLDIARMYKQEEIENILIENNARRNIKPIVDRLSINYTNDFFNDYMMGGQANIHESKYNASFLIGWEARLAAKRVLVEEDDVYYQYWARRHLMYLGIKKRLNLYDDGLNNKSGIYMGISGVYSYGGYRGVAYKPKGFITFMPELGMFYQHKSFGFEAAGVYADLNEYDVSNFRIRLGLFYLFNLKSRRAVDKKISWLEY